MMRISVWQVPRHPLPWRVTAYNGGFSIIERFRTEDEARDFAALIEEHNGHDESSEDDPPATRGIGSRA